MMMPRDFNRSTGPTSEAGKHVVSFNSTKHNLTSTGKDRAALPGEEAAFEQFCSEISQALAPVGVIEKALAEDIAADRFRLRRARAMERALFAKIERENEKAIDAPTAKAEAWIDAGKGLQRLALYANRLQRAIDKNTQRLEALQAERKAAEAKAREEAILLTQYAESKGETYDPASDGFVFSRDEIMAAISRARRLDEARNVLVASATAVR